jgi:hypothetical protein
MLGILLQKSLQLLVVFSLNKQIWVLYEPPGRLPYRAVNVLEGHQWKSQVTWPDKQNQEVDLSALTLVNKITDISSMSNLSGPITIVARRK